MTPSFSTICTIDSMAPVSALDNPFFRKMLEGESYAYEINYAFDFLIKYTG